MWVDLTERQLAALRRVAASMNMVGARISVTGENLLSADEMLNLEYRLASTVAPSRPVEVPE